ncbi:hypothetical protein C8R45DRAFT_1147798 [Mycena sanguinolenta]|nr:hypothetical protein C8R45DRAFT_1147798 [Mycena sanguinolenta]
MNGSTSSLGWTAAAPTTSDMSFTQFLNSPASSSSEFPLHPFEMTPSHQSHRGGLETGLLWPQGPQNTIQNADHQTLLRNGNTTYMQLLTAHAKLQGSYSTLEQAYILLARSIPQVFHHIDNPLQIPIPAASSASTSLNATLSLPSVAVPIQSPKTKPPKIKHWSRDDYSGNKPGLTTVSDTAANVLDFLEHVDGTAFTPEEITDVRKHARECFQTLINKGLAPTTWSHADSIAANFFRTEMLTKYPDISLCLNNWKVDTMASLVYGQWSRGRKEEILESQAKLKEPATKKEKKKKRKKTESDDDEDEVDLFSAKRQRRDHSDAKRHRKGKTPAIASASASTSALSPSVDFIPDSPTIHPTPIDDSVSDLSSTPYPSINSILNSPDDNLPPSGSAAGSQASTSNATPARSSSNRELELTSPLTSAIAATGSADALSPIPSLETALISSESTTNPLSTAAPPILSPISTAVVDASENVIDSAPSQITQESQTPPISTSVSCQSSEKDLRAPPTTIVNPLADYIKHESIHSWTDRFFLFLSWTDRSLDNWINLARAAGSTRCGCPGNDSTDRFVLFLSCTDCSLDTWIDLGVAGGTGSTRCGCHGNSNKYKATQDIQTSTWRSAYSTECIFQGIYGSSRTIKKKQRTSKQGRLERVDRKRSLTENRPSPHQQDYETVYVFLVHISTASNLFSSLQTISYIGKLIMEAGIDAVANMQHSHARSIVRLTKIWLTPLPHCVHGRLLTKFPRFSTFSPHRDLSSPRSPSRAPDQDNDGHNGAGLERFHFGFLQGSVKDSVAIWRPLGYPNATI